MVLWNDYPLDYEPISKRRKQKRREEIKEYIEGTLALIGLVFAGMEFIYGLDILDKLLGIK